MSRSPLTDAPRLPLLGLLLGIVILLAGCGSDDESQADQAAGAGQATTQAETAESATTDESDGEGGEQRFPEIVEATATEAGKGRYDFDVTISSPYDTPERYADGWRVLGPDEEQYGSHELAHDHASEQPFTRTQTGVEIPDGVAEVTIEGRDLSNGFGGETVSVTLPGR